MPYSFEQPVTVNSWHTAVVHVDVQSAFFRAQGTPRTERIAQKLNQLIAPFKKAGFAQFAAFSKAGTREQASLIPALAKEGIFCFEKSHESAARHTGLGDRLHKAGRSTVIITGFHATSCVMQTALDLQRGGFQVIIDPSLTGEGQRGRGLSDGQIDQKMERALWQLAAQGVRIGPITNLPAPQAV